MAQIDIPLTEEEDRLVGPARLAINQGTSPTHDPETARRLGFRGALVWGGAHLNVFVPLMLRLFGNAWFENGTLSLYLLNAVVHGEAVQAVAQRPSAGATQAKVWARRTDDAAFTVGAGTASLGADPTSELRTRDLRLADPTTLRVFRDLAPGTVLGEEIMTLSLADQRAGIDADSINEPLPWYTEDSPWGDRSPVHCRYSA